MQFVEFIRCCLRIIRLSRRCGLGIISLSRSLIFSGCCCSGSGFIVDFGRADISCRLRIFGSGRYRAFIIDFSGCLIFRGSWCRHIGLGVRDGCLRWLDFLSGCSCGSLCSVLGRGRFYRFLTFWRFLFGRSFCSCFRIRLWTCNLVGRAFV